MKTLLSARILLATGALLFATSTAHAQLSLPRASPRAELTVQVGLAQVTLDYSRPGAKDRTIFGGLEPYGVVWRTGADASTKISFDRDVMFGGHDVPAGTYALYTIPQPESWTVILSRNTSLWGAGGYSVSDDLLRVEVPVRHQATPWETLTLDFRGFHPNGAEFFIRWADVEVAVPVITDTDAVVMVQIDEQVKNATGPVDSSLYFDAAKYYVERGLELELAAQWVEKAVEQSPQSFWMVYYRADLARTMGKLETAEAWAIRARDSAAAADDDYGYVARSEALLAALEQAQYDY